MQSFYQSWYDYTNVATAVVGLGAFFALFGGKDSQIAQALVAVVTVMSTVASKLGPSKKAKVHSDLQRRFTDLSADIAKRDATPANLKKITSARLTIEKDEPPVRRLVDLLARNEEHRARGRPESDIIPLTWAQRRFGYLRDFGIEKIDSWIAGRPSVGSSE